MTKTKELQSKAIKTAKRAVLRAIKLLDIALDEIERDHRGGDHNPTQGMTCPECGERINVRETPFIDHFKTCHPEYKFSVAPSKTGKTNTLRCEVCNYSVGGFKALTRFHKHSENK